jgi:DUF971 family protein
MAVRPKRIEIKKAEGHLTIAWDDGFRCRYPLDGLRAACPCASCVGGHEHMGKPGSPDMLEIPLVDNRASRLVDAEIVGNYALQLTWMDGHKFGIYRWEYLRQLCPDPQPIEAEDPVG